MFFIMGMNPGEKRLDFSRKIVCPRCGRYGSLEVYMTYMCLSLFFIPVAKWSKRYFVRTTCCSSSCEIDRELGQRIARGEVTELDPNGLHFAGAGWGLKKCASCGFETDQDFAYCPKCGRPF